MMSGSSWEEVLIGRVGEHFPEGMAQWRALRRKLEEHPAHTAHLQRTANSQEPWETDRDYTRESGRDYIVKSLLNPDRGHESPLSPLLDEDMLRGASERML